MSQKAKLYLEYRTRGSLCYVKYSSFEKISKTVGAIFDCDGVLIDEKTSYDKVIKEVTSILVEILTGYKFDEQSLPTQTIYDIRAVGSFNNDANTIQLLVEWLVSKITAEISPKVRQRLEELEGKDLTELLRYRGSTAHLDESSLKIWMDELSRSIVELEGSGLPLQSVEKVILHNEDLVKLVQRILKPDQRYGTSLLNTAFDESFYGSDMIFLRRGNGPFFSFGGRLKEEKVIVTSETLEMLTSRGLKLGICTGRGSWETWRTLGELEKFFEKKACVFIGDYVEADPAHSLEYEKPNPWSLLQAVRNIDAPGAKLYVGNSAEDHLMYLKAKGEVEDLLFAGVTDTDYRRLDYMIENEVDLVIPTVNHLPKIFQLIEEV
ncbi:MAG: HAD family hydrolase [Candidatus Caldarchaeum sp.]|nr:HAD family hydrolase [Candidatus Caldarchaeum sp.]